MLKNLILIILATIFIVLTSSYVLASQALPRYGVNEETKECSKFFMGDECLDCTFPEGWKMIEEFQCPLGYKEVQKDSVCKPRKNSFCCTIGHSGLSGDCEDVVVNDVERKCAFVEDINDCENLPQNWRRAEELEFWGRVCPWDYEWLKYTLNCQSKMIQNNDEQKGCTPGLDCYENNIIFYFSIGLIVFALLIILWSKFIKKK